MTAEPDAPRSAWREATARAGALLPQRSDWQAVKRHPGRDIVAGLTVAVVALPLALAFGETSGMGARAGLVTAIVAGAVAAIFGGSNLQVSGPTGAMTVVLVPIVHRFGPEGVLMVGLMAGAILLGLAVAGTGKFVRLIPVSVVEGFTVGIAVVIALQQVPAMLGVAGAEGDKAWQIAWHAARKFVTEPHATPVVIALLVAGAILLGTRWLPTVPFSLVAVVVASVAVAAAAIPVPLVGEIPAGLPRPSFAFFDPGQFWTLGTAAMAVAVLGALESLLSATVADAMTVSERHDPDRELAGQGLANIASPIFGGMPATAAIARTAVNVRAGAGSKLAALVHALGLLAIMTLAAGWVSKIPLAALAGVLLATTVRMVRVASLRALARSSRTEALVLAATFAITVTVDLVAAVALGLGVAALFALRAISRSARVEAVPLERDQDHSDEEHELLTRHVVAYRFDGPLFFAAAHRFLLELADVADVRVVILRMSRVTVLDATGAHVLGDVIEKLEARGTTVILSGISAPHDRVLDRLGVAAHLRRDGRVFADTPSAIRCALAIVSPARPDGAV